MIYFVTLTINVILGAIVFFSNRKKRVNQYFSLLVFSIVGWILTLFFYYELTEEAVVLFIGRTNFAFASLISFSVLLFSLEYPKELQGRFNGISKKTSIIFTIALVLLTIFTPLIDSKEIVQGDHRETEYGLLYWLFIVHFIGLVSYAIIILIKKSRQFKGLEKSQLLYLEWGFFLGTLLGSITNIIAPLMGNYTLQGFGPIATVFFVGATTYAIIRHRLLDIRLVITRSLVYGILLALVTLSFVFITFVSAQFFGNTPTSRNFIAILVASLIVFGLDPLKNFLSRSTDKVFFKAKVDYQSLLREISEILAFEINRDELVRKIRGILQDGLKVKFTATLLRKEVSGKTEKFEALSDLLAQNPNLSLRNDSPLIQFLREHKHFSIVESLDRKIEDTPENKRQSLLRSREEFQRLGAALVTPIFAQGHLIAVLALGPKLSGESFSSDDVQLIEVLSPQIGSAIQKANLFEEVRQFGESLKIKVEQATAEVRERNISLLTIQKITKDITQTLDFNKVVQNIANAVATELGYLGAILVFLDDDGKTVRARAITETPLTQKALKLLPIHFDRYSSDINVATSTSLGHQVIRSGEMKVTADFAEVVCPPLPKLLAKAIQKVVGIKSMVIIPIISEQKTIGVIEIGLAKPQEQISEQEIATMQSMADELGVVSRNIKLFEQIQKTNAQLEDANFHLKELDQAKSEFVSIASHQLRTPMTGIMGYLSMMTAGDFGKVAPEHLKILQDLLAESQRMIRLINQFLNVSKIEAGKFSYQKSPVQLEDLISREIKEITKAANDKGLKLKAVLPKLLLPKVVADGDKLQDVILNLMDNAIKYTDKGTIDIGVEQLGDQLRFYVKDSGIGIKHEDASALFNKFVRGSGIAQIHPDGSGLGLFIAKSIIDAHGGRIWADSEGEGKGSTFQFTIPINPPPEPNTPIAQAAAATAAKEKPIT